jgi:hypothetical protein
VKPLLPFLHAQAFCKSVPISNMPSRTLLIHVGVEEIDRLMQVFSSIIERVPEMTTLLTSLRKYCMSETTFDETDFHRVLNGVLKETPNLSRLKLNLPFQVIGRASRTATLLLATTFACFAQRPSDFSPLQTLVLDHVSDSTILDIGQNHLDLGNALKTFKSLRNLVISIKRQERSNPSMNIFSNRLWMLISEAGHLESLCIIGWNTKRCVGNRRHRARVNFNDWVMKSLPYQSLDEKRTLKYLRFLELKRIDIDPSALEQLIEQNSTSLKELYLNEVYLKIFRSTDLDQTPLWIGHGDGVDKPAGRFWLAEKLQGMESLNLEVLRATGIGYDDYDPEIRSNRNSDYDLVDPTGHNRTFDQRFVEAVLGIPSPPPKKAAPAETLGAGKPEVEQDVVAIQRAIAFQATLAAAGGPIREMLYEDYRAFLSRSLTSSTPSKPEQLRKVDWDVETFQRHHNTTSHWKRCIDGLFYNHNEKALEELQKIIGVADRGMTLLSDEIDRIHGLTEIPREGG